MASDKHEQIRRRAYELWEEEGRPEGAALRHWLQAVDELEGEDEHETMQDLIDEDDRDDAALLQGAGESGDFDSPYSDRPKTRAARMDRRSTPKEAAGAKLVPRKSEKTQGP